MTKTLLLEAPTTHNAPSAARLRRTVCLTTQAENKASADSPLFHYTSVACRGCALKTYTSETFNLLRPGIKYPEHFCTGCARALMGGGLADVLPRLGLSAEHDSPDGWTMTVVNVWGEVVLERVMFHEIWDYLYRFNMIPERRGLVLPPKEALPRQNGTVAS